MLSITRAHMTSLFPPGYHQSVGASDPRNNMPRAGRVLMGRGRDAVDAAITNTFGPNTLTSFKVWTDEVEKEPARPLQSASARLDTNG